MQPLRFTFSFNFTFKFINHFVRNPCQTTAAPSAILYLPRTHTLVSSAGCPNQLCWQESLNVWLMSHERLVREMCLRTLHEILCSCEDDSVAIVLNDIGGEGALQQVAMSADFELSTIATDALQHLRSQLARSNSQTSQVL